MSERFVFVLTFEDLESISFVIHYTLYTIQCYTVLYSVIQCYTVYTIYTVYTLIYTVYNTQYTQFYITINIKVLHHL